MASKKDYFICNSDLINLILAIIPFTAWLLGVVTRFKEGAIIQGVVRIFGGLVIWVLDLIFMLKDKKIFRINF